MEAIPTESPEEQGKLSAPIPASSVCPQEDDALSQLMSKDPVLGQVMKIILGKLNETNRKLDSFLKDLPRDLHTCHDQVNKLTDVPVKSIEDHKATRIMESIQTVIKTEQPQEQKPKDKGRQVAEDCLSLPVILRRILEPFSDKELIRLSIVNKLWNYEARSVLRDRGCLMATISSTPPACHKLVQFASDLEKMRVVPFSGIQLDLSHSRDDGSCPRIIPTGSLDLSLQVILDRLSWKHLSVVFYGQNLEKFKHCPALLLVTKILEDHCGGLEELSISNVDREKTDFLRSVIGHRSLPCLKILKIKEGLTFRPPTNGFMKGMVSCARNLDEFHIAGRMEFSENVMEGSSGVLVATSGLSPLTENVCESLAPSLRTGSMEVLCASFMEFDVELLKRVVPRLIQASHKTLTSLRMDLLFAIPLMCYGICLENVTELGIYFAYPLVDSIQPYILRLVRTLDFTRIFPKLCRVEIDHWEFRNFSFDDISGFLKQKKLMARDLSPDRAINIRHLDLCCLEEDTPPLMFLAQMFPHVKTISVETTAGHKFPFTLLWQHFSRLAELHIDLTESGSSAQQLNWDGVFCGIFPEEVAELRMKDDDYLKAVNLVAVMPSITCMRDLRSFRLRYSSRVDNETQDPTRIFSKVTKLIGFSRCPSLSIKFQTT